MPDTREFPVSRLIAQAPTLLGVPVYTAAGALAGQTGSLTVDAALALVTAFLGHAPVSPPAPAPVIPGFPAAVETVTAAYDVRLSDAIILADATAAPFTVTLPAAAGNTGISFAVKATTASTHVVELTSRGGLIEGQTVINLGTPASGAPYVSLTVVSDGTNWHAI